MSVDKSLTPTVSHNLVGFALLLFFCSCLWHFRQAFNKLLRELGVNNLNDIPVNTLTDVLLYHVIDGKVLSSDLKDGRVDTLEGSKLKVDVKNNGRVIFDNRAEVVDADIQARNGVIHKIDMVLLP